MAPLRSTLLVVASLFHQIATAAPVDSSSGSTQCQQSKVLILGAGMAGISAGNTLQLNGVHDFKIIEYQGRVGGRTLHTSFGSKSDGSQWTVELGTNWITGLHTPNGSTPGQGKFNPIWGLAEASGLVTVSDEARSGPLLFDQDGPSDWNNATAEYSEADDKLFNLAADLVKNGRPDLSARAGFELVGWDSTNDAYKQAAETVAYEDDGAAPVDLSSLILGEIGSAASEGPILGEFERFVVDQRGYDLVTRHLAGEFLGEGDARLVLDSPITNVTYSADGVTVHTANDTCFHADYAICTFSLGVLQQSINGKAPVQFDPAFPEWKATSTFANVMGIYTKLFYQFEPEDVWWDRDVQDFLYASPTTKGYWAVWESLDFPGSPLEGSGIIFATMVFDQSKRVERQSDDETMREGLEVLAQMFPNVTIPEPKAFTYPRWGMTPWSFGSYSNWAAGYSLEQHANFRANLDRLWFAGEATSSEYWGYLHGAYFEGELAGQEVAACVNGTKSCADRKRYTDLKGAPKSAYNKDNGFQDSIDDLLQL